MCIHIYIYIYMHTMGIHDQSFLASDKPYQYRSIISSTSQPLGHLGYLGASIMRTMRLKKGGFERLIGAPNGLPASGLQAENLSSWIHDL